MKIFFGSCCGVVAGSLPKEGCFGNSSARSPEQVCNKTPQFSEKKTGWTVISWFCKIKKCTDLPKAKAWWKRSNTLPNHSAFPWLLFLNHFAWGHHRSWSVFHLIQVNAGFECCRVQHIGSFHQSVAAHHFACHIVEMYGGFILWSNGKYLTERIRIGGVATGYHRWVSFEV